LLDNSDDELTELRITGLEIIALRLLERRNSLSKGLEYLRMAIDLKDDKICDSTSQIVVYEMDTAACNRHISVKKMHLVSQCVSTRQRLLNQYPMLTTLAKFNIFQCLHLELLMNNRRLFNKYMTFNFKTLAKLWLDALALQSLYLTPFDFTFIENSHDFLQYLCYVMNAKPDGYASFITKAFKFCLFSIQRGLDLLMNEQSNDLNSLFHQNSSIDFFKHVRFEDVFGTESNYQSPQVLSTNLFDLKSKRSAFIYLTTFSMNLLRILFYVNKNLNLSELDLKQCVKGLVKFSDESKFGYSVLELSMRTKLTSELVLVNRFFSYCEPISEKCIKCMLLYGAEPDKSTRNDRPGSKDTCFNSSLFKLDPGSVSKEAFNQLVCLCLKCGAHFDSRNGQNLTASELYRLRFGEEITSLIDSSYCKISLQCLCARQIMKSRLDYQSCLPLVLCLFVNKH
jgi:hypothetical protein